MKTMIAAAAVALCSLVFALPAAAQDSNRCVVADSKPVPNWKNEYSLRFKNQCSWPVTVVWWSNEFGRKGACDGGIKGVDISAGKSYVSRQLGVEGYLEVIWCAEAYRRDHPDYRSCPRTCE